MRLRSQVMYAIAFLTLAFAYFVWFNVAVRTDARWAETRFDALLVNGSWGRAAPYGERLLRMRREAGVPEEKLASLKADTARAHIGSHNYARGAVLSEQALASNWGKTLTERERADMEDGLARAHVFAGELDRAASIYSDFLELSGDEGGRSAAEKSGTLEAYYADKVGRAANLFAETLKPVAVGRDQGSKKTRDAVASLHEGTSDQRLATTNDLVSLGAYYALREDGLYAAAGLLSQAYVIRRELYQGAQPSDRDEALQRAVQVVLILGPVYIEMGRLEDAEKLYLEAFHDQERAKGSNNTELSLYIKLLAGVYEKQGRATEAQALNEHMRGLFRDAFGAQRYAANRTRDRRADVDRPVSQQFPLPASYAPTDLIGAASFAIPLSKSADAEEMRLRLAADPLADPREQNLPARLAQLISLCRAESGERISLRSGYRSYVTQRDLYQRIGALGTVTPPGISEHQTGLAADIDVNGRLMRQSDATFQCFQENAFRFGFILSYPPGNKYLPAKDSYEPWHWRYVGVRTAQLYREAGPANKPQEFLAALDCYEAKAAANEFPTAGEADVCLASPQVVAAAAGETKRGSENGAARKLNNPAGGSGTR
ncbi:MAG: M15 family metallopeptidase [Parvularculaceae bacterium]|nr:M15 family metallopeptidase [Parvularculaceae bacterium]